MKMISNECVLDMLGEERRLLEIIRGRKSEEYAVKQRMFREAFASVKVNGRRKKARQQLNGDND